MRKTLVGAAAVAVVVGGGTLLVSPAGAAVATNWNKIWKTQIKPRADKRYVTRSAAKATYATQTSLGNYYTKAEAQAALVTVLQGYAKTSDLSAYAKTSDLSAYATQSDLANFYTKTEADSTFAKQGDSYTKAQSDAKYAAESELANYYTKTQSDSNYAAKSDLGNYYTKTQSDQNYAPAQSVYKGTFYVVGDNDTAGRYPLYSGDVSFPAPLASAPTVTVVGPGDTASGPCAGGTVASPTATKGNLCVFIQALQAVNAGHAQTAGNGFLIVNPLVSGDPGASALGFGIRIENDGTTGHTAAYGSWAVGQ